MSGLRPAGFVEGEIEADCHARPEIVEGVAVPTVNSGSGKEHVVREHLGADETEAALVATNDNASHVRCPFHATATLGDSST